MTSLPSAAEILDHVGDAVVVVDRAGVIAYVNAAAADLFGYRSTELVGRAVEVLIPEETRSTHAGWRTNYVRSPVARAMGTGLPLEARRSDGSVIEVDIKLEPLQHWVVASVRPVGWRSTSERDLLDTLDTMAQHLFAVGMSLAALRNDVPEPVVARLDDTSDLVDHTLELARGSGQRHRPGGDRTAASSRFERG